MELLSNILYKLKFPSEKKDYPKKIVFFAYNKSSSFQTKH